MVDSEAESVLESSLSVSSSHTCKDQDQNQNENENEKEEKKTTTTTTDSPSSCSICGKDIERFKSQLYTKIHENHLLSFQCRVLKTELINLIGTERTELLFDLKLKSKISGNSSF